MIKKIILKNLEQLFALKTGCPRGAISRNGFGKPELKQICSLRSKIRENSQGIGCFWQGGEGKAVRMQDRIQK